nr:hypothetical protein [Tanacetum cinerariifolium]
MVNIRNSSLEILADEGVKQRVTNHVPCVLIDLNKKFDNVSTSVHNLMSQLWYLANDVNRLKGGEGNSRFNRMSKLEFSKFYGEDLEVEVEECLKEGEDESDMIEYELSEEVPHHIPHILLNSLFGVPTHYTMRLKVMCFETDLAYFNGLRQNGDLCLQEGKQKPPSSKDFFKL